MSLRENIERLDNAIRQLEQDRDRLVQNESRLGVLDQGRSKINAEIERIRQTLEQEKTYRNAQARLIPAYEHHMRVYRAVEDLEALEAQNERYEMFRRIAYTLGGDRALDSKVTELFGSQDLAVIEAGIRSNPEGVKTMLRKTLEDEAFQINALNGVVDDRVAGRDKYRAYGIAREITDIDKLEAGLEAYDGFDKNKVELDGIDSKLAAIEEFERLDEAINIDVEKIRILDEIANLMTKLEEALDESTKLMMHELDEIPEEDENEFVRKIQEIGAQIEPLMAELAKINRSVEHFRIDFTNPLQINLNEVMEKKDNIERFKQIRENRKLEAEKKRSEFLKTQGFTESGYLEELAIRKDTLQKDRKKLLEGYGLPEDANANKLQEWKKRFEGLMKKLGDRGITRDNFAGERDKYREQFIAILRKYDINPNISEAEMKALMQDIQAEIDKQVEKIREKFNERHVILTAEKLEEAAQVGNTPPPQTQTQSQAQAQVVQNGAQPQPTSVSAGNTNPVRGNAGAPLGAQMQNIPTGTQQAMLQASQTPQIASNPQAQQTVNQSSRNTETTEYIGASYLDRTYPRQKLAEWNIPSNIDEFMRNAGEDKSPKIKDGKAYSYAVAGDKLIYVEEDIRRYIVNPKMYLTQELKGLRDRMMHLCKTEATLEKLADYDEGHSMNPRFAKLVSPKKKERNAAVKEIMQSIEELLKDPGSRSYAELEMFLALRTAVTPMQVMEVLSRVVNCYRYESNDLPQTVLREDSGLVFKTHLAVRQKPTLLQEASKTQHRKPKGVMVRPFEIPDSELGPKPKRDKNNPSQNREEGKAER